MIDPTDLEIEALYGASNFAGEYLESIGKTDLASLSEDEWMTLMEATVTGYQEKLQNLVAGRTEPSSHIPEEDAA